MGVSVWLGSITLGIAVLLLLGACWVSLRGMGGISALRIQQAETQAALERVDERITREVKTRAGLARAEQAEEERTIMQQSAEVLAKDNVLAMPQARPKRTYHRGS